MHALLIAGVGTMAFGSLVIGAMIGLEIKTNDPWVKILGKIGAWVFAVGGVLFGLAQVCDGLK